jgi:hypothetical protein
VPGSTTASGTSFAPTGNVAAVTVQAAIAEVDSEKIAKAGDTMAGHLFLPIAPAAANAVRKDYVDASLPNANVLINSDFRVNQAGYISAGVLPAGGYGHDQWKGGAAGGDYSFTQLKSSTQITIAVGKTLIQPIEDANVSGGSYVLSWTGTSQARAGVNSLTPSGSYAVSPLSIAGQTAGTVMSVEFSAGTLSNVKLERGSTVTPFIMRPVDQELMTCQRYYQKWSAIGPFQGVAFSATQGQVIGSGPVMRGSPTLLKQGIRVSDVFALGHVLTDLAISNGPPAVMLIFTVSGGGLTGGRLYRTEPITGADYIAFDARL